MPATGPNQKNRKKRKAAAAAVSRKALAPRLPACPEAPPSPASTLTVCCLGGRALALVLGPQPTASTPALGTVFFAASFPTQPHPDPPHRGLLVRSHR